MKVDNRLNTAKLKIFYMIILAVIFSLSAYYAFENQMNLFYRSVPFIIGILVLLYIFMLVRKSDYFYLEYIGNKAIIRFYSAHPIFRKYKAIEVQKVYFFDYEIKKVFFGIRKYLFVTVKTPKGKFNYPPLSIVFLNKEQTQKMISILDELKK